MIQKSICTGCKTTLPVPTAWEMKYGQECVVCQTSKTFGTREQIDFLLEKEIAREKENAVV